MKITQTELCCGCGLCAARCPRHCISMEKRVNGDRYPVIREDLCVGCGRCAAECPVNDKPRFFVPRRAYAAWNTQAEPRRNAASGGVASAIYRFCADMGQTFVGARMDPDFKVMLDVGSTHEDIEAFRGSKYVYSSMERLFARLLGEERLLPAAVIALPCQIAAMRRVLPDDGTLFVDILCHGVCSEDYLRDHICAEAKGREISRVDFRDPAFDTEKFVFSLYQGERCVYRRRVRSEDVYQIAYHGGLSYRPSCYRCPYARGARVSDLTIGDYFSLGREAPPYREERHHVSLVLANTKKGQDFLSDMEKGGYLVCYERPVAEPLSHEAQLRSPTAHTRTAGALAEQTERGVPFSRAAKKILRGRRISNVLFPQWLIDGRIKAAKQIKAVVKWVLR